MSPFCASRRHSGAVLLAFVLALSCAPTLPAPQAADAERPAAPATPTEHPEHVASYTMRAKLDPALHTVHGEGTLTWKNVSHSPVRELWFHLYLNAFKNQSSNFMRAPIGGFRGAIVPTDWGTIDVKKLSWTDGATTHELWDAVELSRPDDPDETDARVPLPREIAPGETVTFAMVWDDKLPQVVERTGYDGSFHMVGQWFPKIAKIEDDGRFAHFPFHHLGEFYADFGAYDVTLDVPESFTLGATGPATESKVEGGRRVERHVQADVHDFAWTAWDGFQKRTETIAGVTVTALYPPGYDDLAERELATMRFALPHYGERYGAYPYTVLTLVHPPATVPEAGGMEYPTLITTGSPSWTPRGLLTPELVTIHEFGHQYFYGLFASDEVTWPFLDEGLNSYAEAEAMAKWRGAGSLMRMFDIELGDAEGHAFRGNMFSKDEKVAQPAYAFTTGTHYGALVYGRTSTILETMRRVHGDDAMRRALGTYAKRARFRHPRPDDLLGAIKDELGERAAETLRVALMEKGWVDYAVTSVASAPVHPPAGLFDRGGKRETVPADSGAKGTFEGWVLVTRRGTLSFPVEVELVFADGSRKREAWDGIAESVRLPFHGTSPLRAVLVDPDARILLDEDRTNDFATAPKASRAGAGRVLERATYWAGLALGAIAP
ncbi:MAG: M1 family metallopeptidase [Polyangiaceae bacterium]